MLGRQKKQQTFIHPNNRYGVGTVLGVKETEARVERSRGIKRGIGRLVVASVLAVGALQATGEINLVPWQDESGNLDWSQIDVVPFDGNRNVPEPGTPPAVDQPQEQLKVNIGG